jgi:hypothetical protein
MDALTAMPDIDWPSNSLYQNYQGQIQKLQEHYSNLPVTSLQGVSAESEWRSFVMHTPYTTAFRLFGDGIFEHMMLEEELAQGIFDYVMRQYLNLWDDISARMGWTGSEKANLHFGDCAATMLSPDLYERFNLPHYTRLMADYKSCTIHSCGPSTHLLELFARVPKVALLQLGAGTDLVKARELFPTTRISAYYAAPEILEGTPEGIERKLWEMCETLGDNADINGSSVDPNTPEENILAYLKTAKRINEQAA